MQFTSNVAVITSISGVEPKARCVSEYIITIMPCLCETQDDEFRRECVTSENDINSEF